LFDTSFANGMMDITKELRVPVGSCEMATAAVGKTATDLASRVK